MFDNVYVGWLLELCKCLCSLSFQDLGPIKQNYDSCKSKGDLDHDHHISVLEGIIRTQFGLLIPGENVDFLQDTWPLRARFC